MPCTCTTITAYALSCTPTFGGVASAYISNGQDEQSQTIWVEIQTLPETSGYTAVMSYDKQKNLKYWTSNITLNIGALNEDAATLADALPCPTARQVKLNMNSGHTVTFSDVFIKEANFEPGIAKTEGGNGVLTFEAITMNAPSVTDPNE